MLGKIRYHIFWFADCFKKNSVKRYYREIRFLNEKFNSESAQILLKKYRKDLLSHAINTTSFYKEYYSKSFNELPVINKNIIRDNFNAFESITYKRKQRYKVSTSGSTGTPFVTYLNKNKRLRNSADTIYFAEKSGFKVGDMLLYIRLWDDQHKKMSLTSWILNIVSHNISDLRDVDIEGLLSKIKNNKSPKGLLAYASAYDTICQYMDENGSEPIDCNIKSVIAISERLTDYAKESMEKYFGVPVVSRYSASETGILAQQSINCDNFNINWASYYVEILNFDNDEPAIEGEIGRIIITDLFNYSVPLIRYDTGDLGSMIVGDSNNGPVLTNVEGRKMDMLYNTKGELISSHIVHKICLFKGIKQYQLIQKSEKEYIFKVNTSNEFKEEEGLVESYKKYFGDDSIISIEYVDNIPILSSGKRKKVINLYKKD
tara:strand:- start:1375 stop:2670 length:1296 start_codon:yes stop_codon:yes gene_type:complete